MTSDGQTIRVLGTHLLDKMPCKLHFPTRTKKYKKNIDNYNCAQGFGMDEYFAPKKERKF